MQHLPAGSPRLQAELAYGSNADWWPPKSIPCPPLHPKLCSNISHPLRRGEISLTGKTGLARGKDSHFVCRSLTPKAHGRPPPAGQCAN